MTKRHETFHPEALTQYRQLRRWSQYELAIRARLHPSDISKFERGMAVPYPAQLTRLADALGIEPSALSAAPTPATDESEVRDA